MMKTPLSPSSSSPGRPVWRKRVAQLCCLVVCFLMMAAVALQKNHTLLGTWSLEPTTDGEQPVLSRRGDTAVINTAQLAPDVRGYGGATPLEVKLLEGRIVAVSPLPNAESPEWFGRLEKAGFWHSWDGLTPAEAAALEVDAVSGATYSSRAVRQNVAAAAQYAANNSQALGHSAWAEALSSPKVWVALVVVLLGAIVPLFVRSRRYRMVQLVLNVAVLGCWTGFFLSYGLMVGWMAGGVQWSAALVPVLLLVVAFVFPLFGRSNHYCTWLCPLGSLQALCAMASYRHVALSHRTQQVLTWVRRTLWGVLMLLMWNGVAFGWMDYELFASFQLSSAPMVVVVLGGVVFVLSFFIDRPYCRFICPTGTLVRISQNQF